MQAPERPGVEAPTPLVATAGTGVEGVHTVRQRPGDGGIVAGFKMQAVHLLVAAPVATPQLLPAAQAQAHGHRFEGVAPVGTEQHEVGSQPLRRQFEEGLAQVLAAPGAPAGAVGAVEVVHAQQHRRRDGIARQWRDGETGPGNRLPFPLDVAALVGVEAAEVVGKLELAVPLPLAPRLQPAGAAGLFGEIGPVVSGIEKVGAEDAVAPAEVVHQLQHQGRDGGRVFAGGDEKAVAHRRCQRTHAQQLGVVGAAQLCGQLRKRLVEHELAVAVALQVEGRHGDGGALAAEAEVAALPAVTRTHRAGASRQSLGSPAFP